MADWRDLTVIVCSIFIVLGAAALSTSAQTFSIVKGTVVEKGIGVIQHDGRPVVTNTISVLIENDDRVFDIKRGTVVQYAVSEQDVQTVEIGSAVELFVSSSSPTVRILSQPSAGAI